MPIQWSQISATRSWPDAQKCNFVCGNRPESKQLLFTQPFTSASFSLCHGKCISRAESHSLQLHVCVRKECVFCAAARERRIIKYMWSNMSSPPFFIVFFCAMLGQLAAESSHYLGQVIGTFQYPRRTIHTY